jgi:hypothetical protein
LKQLEGRITISRTTSNKSEDKVTINITDASTGCCLLKTSMSVEGFGFAVTGLGFQKCDVDLYQEACAIAGYVREHKHELLPQPEMYKGRYTEDEIQAMLTPYEIDGWEGRSEDLFNSHNSQGDKVRVLFVRYVPTDAQQPSAG